MLALTLRVQAAAASKRHYMLVQRRRQQQQQSCLAFAATHCELGHVDEAL